MPPALEVINNNSSSSNGTEFDDAVLKAAIEEDITETESSEGPIDITEANIIDGEDWNHITKPGEHDVLLGRGGGTNNHSGNIKFRKLVNEHKMRYLACSKVEKPKVARQVVAIWRKLEPVGRFLARKDDSKRGPGSVKAADNVWYEVGDKKAREKASQCLRERTPDVLPYIKHLREQQNAVTAQGVMTVRSHLQQQELMNSPQHHAHGVVSMNPHHPMNFNGLDPQFSPQAFPRRNSMPTPPGVSPAFSPHHRSSLQGQFGTQPQHGGSGAGMMPPQMMAPDMGLDADGVAELPDADFQQHMVMMQQNMMQQQYQMQRLQQSRMHRQMNGMESYNMNNVGNHNLPPNQINTNDNKEQPQHDPQLTESNPAVQQHKRSREDDDDKRAAPDRATSLMSLTPANPDDNEISLEQYRQQLEEYISNSNGNDDDANDELQDDWEKEREHAVRQQKETARGVNRNVSGMSCLSGKSGMSLVSGFSGFSDMNMSKDRELKMSMARSVCSNLSLMSDMTDLSHNIDNLSLYDDE